MKPRMAWHLGANSGVAFWLLALFGLTLTHPFVPDSRWLMIHLLLLGALTNAILVWSTHFARALLRPPPGSRRGEVIRLVGANVGAAIVVVGILSDRVMVTLTGALVLGGSIAAHGISLALMARRALPGRFGTTIHHYVAAALLLPVGAILGTLLATSPTGTAHGRFIVAHVAANVLGWIGLTVLGTLLTLWPTILRTRIPERAEASTRRALPGLVAGILTTGLGAAVGVIPIVALGVLAYLLAALWSLLPMLVAARSKPPQTYAAWSVLAAAVWFVLSLVWLVGQLALAPDWDAAAASADDVVVPLTAGFAAQLLLGALTYLVPVVLGGGPARVRELTEVLERGNLVRVVVTNLGLAVCLLPVPSLVRVVVSMLVLAALASFLPLLAITLRRAAKPAPDPQPPMVKHVPEPSPITRRRHTGMAAVGLAAVVIAVALGAAADPVALGGVGTSAAGGITATGQTTTVTVTAKGMRFHPAKISVPAGNRLVIELVNEDPDVHDLALESGQSTGRIAQGGHGRLEVPVAGRSLDGWCTIAGHRQMGMVFAVEAIGGEQVAAPTPTATSTSGHEGMHHPTGSATPGYDFMASAPAGFTARDATLPPASTSRVHRIDLTAREVDADVAIGVRQRLWTFNGTAPGPVIRGRVGDTFEVTLHNDGTMGHSIDFHAGSLAPDQPMRTIAPGETNTFTFTATRAGVWMYHCSSMPMSLHIASGMFGAVVIDPPNLPAVDHEYLIVQSESYLGTGSGADPAKVNAETPDAVVFNGFANQYDHDPLRARVGERVRIWVLDAGPNRPSSFHVVGGQFDTVMLEGAYTLRPGQPGSIGGSQALGLQPAQGGFVELALPQAGHYPFVSHLMVDAERGAHGILEVTP